MGLGLGLTWLLSNITHPKPNTRASYCKHQVDKLRRVERRPMRMNRKELFLQERWRDDMRRESSCVIYTLQPTFHVALVHVY